MVLPMHFQVVDTVLFGRGPHTVNNPGTDSDGNWMTGTITLHGQEWPVRVTDEYDDGDRVWRQVDCQKYVEFVNETMQKSLANFR